VKSLLADDIRHRLRRSRLVLRSAEATVGIGDRRSRGRGPGIEFADYRDYQPGDDFRYLDRHVYARLGKTVIKQFSLDQQAQVTLLLDATASMGIGAPVKLGHAVKIAAALSLVTLSGSDRLLVGVFGEDGIGWHPRVGSAKSLPGLLAWLGGVTPSGISDLRDVALRSVSRLRPGGMLIVVSDWMLEGIGDALDVWRAAEQELVAYQVVSPDEVDPGRAATGPLRLVDAETGESLESAMDGDVLGRYRHEFRAWQKSLRDRVHEGQGRWFGSSSDDDLGQIVSHEWREKGLIT
jgi:uncharacterized protein (DUF58 family)